MITRNAILTLIIATISTFPLYAQQATGQQLEVNSENSRIIVEENFNCFQSLHCLKRMNPFKNSNLDEINLNSQRHNRYVVAGSSKNETLHAEYNGDGELIRATVVQRNVPLPSIIYANLSKELSGWYIIGNEVIIENFDKKQIEYKVILQNDSEVRVEYFDSKGKQRTPLAFYE